MKIVNLCHQWLNHKVILGCTLSAAMVFMAVGILFWGAFNTALEQTNEMSFCISCHEMEDNVYPEYLQTVHYKNRTGVRATCPDCHVPKEWQHMIVRKIQASRELFHKLIGSIDTAEKFKRKRIQLAKHVWQSMQQTDSRECRNCHNFDAMDITAQQSRSGLVHEHAQQRQKTCIDCHKGIAHQLPEGVVPYKGGSDEDHHYYENQQLPCYRCHQDMPKVEEQDWGF
ncbi:NapC/NirT family cytochrome c [Shewanella gelidimarina]|uniref:NapC/NirT family cytochrome c n=1 Tax=Shewanella gelidimarina TaxID=56813 RepID=UPI00200E5012|nr:NapC/NirT family cytochrome c [Shewanella gelidimarina]MCL1058577.1 NapC/NirT family cytochrome c [Shewanella gelidimarina]